jgi:hypothetical protein
LDGPDANTGTPDARNTMRRPRKVLILMIIRLKARSS